MINLSIPRDEQEMKPRITVVGVGGAGGNAVNNMIRSNLVGCEFVVCNTDAQAMQQSTAHRKIQLGIGVTRGLGAGSRPDVGRAAAEEALDEILEAMQDSNMVFITAGMGGGTGTGGAPVIARIARESGILTIGVVTKPFHFEGTHRMRIAEAGIEELQKFVDTLIIIPNQNLFRVANDRTTFADAFKMADDVLHSGVRGVTDLMVMPGLINLDFADIRTVMSEMGKAMMGTGEAEGDRRSIDAAEAAISNPLLEDVSMKGAKGVLINITGGPDLMLFEVEQAANRIRAEVDPDANIIFGNTILPEMEGRIRVSVVATGIDAETLKLPEKVHTLRPHLKPQAYRIEPVKPAAPVNPVQAQVESLAAELNPAPAADDTLTLGGKEAPAILEPAPAPAAAAVKYPATESYRPLQQQPLAPRSPAEKKTGWSLFGRRKAAPSDMRAEPRLADRPRAMAAPMQRPQPLEQAAPPPAGEDLFPDHGADEQFEIPAFLRRQSN
jgi:cell division protein FtsZ